MVSEVTDVVPASSDAPVVEEPLSKNQQKKILRAAKYEEKKKQKREAEKAAHLKVQEQRRAEAHARLEGMTDEEKAKWREEKKGRVEGRKQGAQEKRARLQQAMLDGQRILVDLSFDEKMSDTEVKSLCQQLAYCYSANSRATKPAHLVLTGVKGRMRSFIDKQCSGFYNWIVTQTEEDYTQLFGKEKEKLVYLTADSSNEIQELDHSKIYIVGGIVDRNRYKRLCADKAEEQGIATARLPIGEYMALSSSTVMCTNHVVEIMIRRQDLGSWQEAFEAVIPTRKRKAEGLAEDKTEESAPKDKAEEHAEEAPGPEAGEGATDELVQDRESKDTPQPASPSPEQDNPPSMKSEAGAQSQVPQ